MGFHKMHHTWTAPVSFVAIYAHPMEHIILNYVPVVAGLALCGSHACRLRLHGHPHVPGYLHPLRLLAPGESGLHDEHHKSFNVNYGNLGIMDILYGTYQLPAAPGGAKGE